MFTWVNLISAAKTSDIPAPSLRAITLAQWILDSKRGNSDLACLHGNFANLKWRPEMEGYATKVSCGAYDDLDEYCSFSSEKAFIRGYWQFISRTPYRGWDVYASDPVGYIRFLYARGFSATNSYADEVLNRLPEARKLLSEAWTGETPAELPEPWHLDCQFLGGVSSEALSIP